MKCYTAAWYFKDCFDHDWCLLANGRVDWSNFDADCGDEFWEGSDDVAFLVAKNLTVTWLFTPVGLVVWQASCW